MMDSKKKAYKIILIYLAIQIIGTFLKNNLDSSNISNDYQVYNLVVQIISTSCIIFIIRRDFNWDEIGFGKIKIKYFFLFLPHLLIILCMINTFIIEISKNSSHYNISIWINLLIILVGSFAAGFCEEVIFRGVLLNTLRKYNSLIYSMIISSVGFSILHITTILSGNSIFYAIINVIIASLLGFAFVALLLKFNNIWPLIIYHSLWNYILIASEMLDISLSKAAYYNNIVNIMLTIILWFIIIKDEKNKKKLIFSK